MRQSAYWHQPSLESPCEDTVAYLHVRQGKGEKDGRVPLDSTAEKALKRWKKTRPKVEYPNVFLSKRSKKPLYPADVRSMLHKYYRKAAIKGASVHTLRHAFCTHHAAKGTNLIVTPALVAQVQVSSVPRGMPA